MHKKKKKSDAADPMCIFFAVTTHAKMTADNILHTSLVGSLLLSLLVENSIKLLLLSPCNNFFPDANFDLVPFIVRTN